MPRNIYIFIFLIISTVVYPSKAPQDCELIKDSTKKSYGSYPKFSREVKDSKFSDLGLENQKVVENIVCYLNSMVDSKSYEELMANDIYGCLRNNLDPSDFSFAPVSKDSIESLPEIIFTEEVVNSYKRHSPQDLIVFMDRSNKVSGISFMHVGRRFMELYIFERSSEGLKLIAIVCP